MFCINGNVIPIKKDLIQKVIWSQQIKGGCLIVYSFLYPTTADKRRTKQLQNIRTTGIDHQRYWTSAAVDGVGVTGGLLDFFQILPFEPTAAVSSSPIKYSRELMAVEKSTRINCLILRCYGYSNSNNTAIFIQFSRFGGTGQERRIHRRWWISLRVSNRFSFGWRFFWASIWIFQRSVRLLHATRSSFTAYSDWLSPILLCWRTTSPLLQWQRFFHKTI